MIAQLVEHLPHECGDLISNAQNPHEARLICTYLKSWALLMKPKTRESWEVHGPAILALSKTNSSKDSKGAGLVRIKDGLRSTVAPSFTLLYPYTSSFYLCSPFSLSTKLTLLLLYSAFYSLSSYSYPH